VAYAVSSNAGYCVTYSNRMADECLLQEFCNVEGICDHCGIGLL